MKKCIISIFLTSCFCIYGFGQFGSSEPCNYNIQCPSWLNGIYKEKISRAVVKFTDNNCGSCTGTLVRQWGISANDQQPLILTAKHCIDGLNSNDLNNMVVIFNYQSPDCTNPSTEPLTVQSVSGAGYINAHKDTDYALLQLNQKPPPQYNVYYNGWTNEKKDMTNTGVCIHHPAGDIKKISEWDKTGKKTNFWKVKWTAGSTEGGSSGAPLFNSSGYVVGQNYASNKKPVCDNRKRNFFGRFDRSWHVYGLSWGLNPNQTSSSHIVSMSGDETCRNNWYFASGNDLHTSDNVTFLSMSTVGTRQYDGVYNGRNTITAQNVTIQSGTSVVFEAGNKVVLEPGFIAEAGSNFVAQIGECLSGCDNGFRTTEELHNEMIIGKREYEQEWDLDEQNLTDVSLCSDNNEIIIFPNPNQGKFELMLPKNFEESTKVQVFNSLGILVFETLYSPSVKINLDNPVNGVYIVSVISKNKTIIRKVVVL